MLFSIAATGCGHPVQETAAHKIADALPGVLGPAARYDVQVDGDPFALARGRARAVNIQGREVRLAPPLSLDTLTVRAADVSFDPKTRRLLRIGTTTFTASMGQSSLDTYLAQSKPLLPGLVVTLLPSTVEARVPVTFLGVQTTAALSGSLRPETDDTSRLDFIASGAHIGVVPLPPGLVNLAIADLNPVVDLSGLKTPLSITDAAVIESRLVLSGTADLQALSRTPER